MSQQTVQRLITEPADTTPCSQCIYHIAGGALVAVIGFALMLTGALAGVGVVVLTLGVLYAVGAWVVSMLPSHPSPDRIP